MPDTVTITMSREQAMDIYERLQDELAESENNQRLYPAVNPMPYIKHRAEVTQLAELFEPALVMVKKRVFS